MKKFSLPKAPRCPTGTVFRNGAMASVLTAAVLAVVILLNLLVNSLPTRCTKLDLSQTGIYTIGETTEQVLAGVDETVNLYYLAQTGSENTNITALLDRYADASSYVHWQQIDPALQPTFASQHGADGATEGSILVECGGRTKLVNAADMYEYDYSDCYTTGAVNTLFDGEQQITSAIYAVTREEVPVVYQLTGHGGQSLPATLQNAIAEQNLQLEELSLASTETIPEDAAVLIIAGPTTDYTEADVTLLRDWLDQGGSLLLLTDCDYDTPNLNGLMADYGLSRLPGMVVEGDSNYHYRGYNYYLLPEVNSHEATAAVQNLYVMLPMAEALKTEVVEGVTTQALLTTSASAYNKAAGYDMETTEQEEGDETGPFDLAVAATRTLEDDAESRVIWAGSTYLLDENADTMVGGGNSQFLLGCTIWLAGEDSTILIAAKSFESDMLVTTAFQADLWGGVATVGLPVFCLVMGAAITIKRRRQ